MNSTQKEPEHFFLNFGDNGIIDKEDMEKMNVSYHWCFSILTIFGIITNSMNIWAFKSLGIKDGVSVSLLSLSFSDLGLCLSGIITTWADMVAKVIEIRFPSLNLTFDPLIINMFVNNFSFVFYVMTGLTTSFLAVVRCLCVAKPLQFNDLLTTSRSVIAHACFALVSFGSYIPLFLQSGVVWKFDTRVNRTRNVAWISDSRESVKEFLFVVFDVVMTFVLEIVLVLCVAVMAFYLKKSAMFRHASKTGSTELGGDEKQQSKLTGKDLQVVIQVLLISVIFVVCAVPKMTIAICLLVIPDFGLGMRYSNLYLVTSRGRRFLDSINSATTFFIYYRFNSRFREFYSKSMWCSDKQ